MPQEPAKNETVFPKHLYPLVRNAIASGEPEQLRKVFRAHPDAIGSTSVFGSWLHEAAMDGKLDIVQLLLNDFGFNINMPGSDSECTPLQYAVSGSHLDVVQELLRRGAVIDTATPIRNPLFSAIYVRNVEIAQLLINHGIDVNVRYTNENYINRSAADYARRLGALEFLPLLEAAGADLTPEQCSDPAAILPADPDTAEKTVYDFFDVGYGMDEVHPQLVTQMLHLSPPLKVYVLPPRRANPVVYCFTAGLSSRAMNTPPEGAEYAYGELFILLPAECYDERQGLAEPYHWIAEWMVRITTQMHECDTCLGGPLTIIANDHPPQPLGPKVKFTCWLLLADQTKARSDGRTVWFYRMVPLYTKERDFEVQNGMRALLDHFDEKKLSFVTDLKRSCLC